MFTNPKSVVVLIAYLLLSSSFDGSDAFLGKVNSIVSNAASSVSNAASSVVSTGMFFDSYLHLF